MTRADPRTVPEDRALRLRSHDARLARDAAIPAVAIGAISVAVGVWARGAHGAAGALIGAVVAIVFFGSGLLVSARTAAWAPSSGMAFAVLAHGTKVVLCGILLAVFGGAGWFDGDVLALAMIATAIAWLAGQVRGFTRLKVFSVEPERSTHGSDSP